MPRKKRVMTGEDETGFTKRPGENTTAFKPQAAVMKRAKPISDNPKIVEGPTPQERQIVGEKPNEVAQPATQRERPTENSHPKKNEALDRGVAAFLTLKIEGQSALGKQVDSVLANNFVNEDSLRKVIGAKLRKACAAQNAARVPTAAATEGDKSLGRIKLMIPAQFVENYRKKHDPLEFETLATVARSWVAPVLEDSVAEGIEDIVQKLKSIGQSVE